MPPGRLARRAVRRALAGASRAMLTVQPGALTEPFLTAGVTSSMTTSSTLTLSGRHTLVDRFGLHGEPLDPEQRPRTCCGGGCVDVSVPPSQADDRIGERGRVVGLDKDAGVTDCLDETANTGSDHGHAGQHRFRGHETEGLVP